jgi:hypothetical protein
MKTPTMLTESKVIQILDLLRQKIPHRVIAQEFGISKKTVSRINTGETWKDVSLRYNQRSPSTHVQLPNLNIVPIAPETADLIDELVGVKNTFCLDFKQPIYWGWFEGWDGVHSVISDGYIIWESKDLVDYAKKLAATEINDEPIYADKAEELPTFELADIMTLSVGDKYTIDATAGDVVRLVGKHKSVCLKQRYVQLATRLKLEIRAAGESDEYVYLTRNKSRSASSPLSIVIACVVTIKEALDE